MSWTTTGDPDRFTAAADAFLQARPVENSILITVRENLRRRGPDAYGPRPPLFGWWRAESGGEVRAAFVWTPPFPPVLSRAPERAARDLAADWAGDPLTGVRGDDEAVRAFGERWCALTGARLGAVQRTRVYGLGELTPRVPAPPGRAVVATAAEREAVLRFQRAFAAEIGEPPAPGVTERNVDDALGYGGRTLWLTPDGEPVALAGGTAPVGGAVRVVSVYTPPEHRGRGYAGAATTAVTRAALDAGARHVLLITDLANPVSNALYQRLGYLPVRDGLSLTFGAAGPSA